MTGAHNSSVCVLVTRSIHKHTGTFHSYVATIVNTPLQCMQSMISNTVAHVRTCAIVRIKHDTRRHTYVCIQFTFMNHTRTVYFTSSPYAVTLVTNTYQTYTALHVFCSSAVVPHLSLCQHSCSWRHSHRAGWGEAKLKHHGSTPLPWFGSVVDEVGPSGCCTVDRSSPKLDNIVCETERRLDSPPLTRNAVLSTRRTTSLQLQQYYMGRQAGERGTHTHVALVPHGQTDPSYLPLHLLVQQLVQRLATGDCISQLVPTISYVCTTAP